MVRRAPHLDRLERAAAKTSAIVSDPPAFLCVQYVDGDTDEVVPELTFEVNPLDGFFAHV